MSKIDTEKIIGIVLTAWANTIATIALVHTIKKDKKKTAPRNKPSKRKRKR